uniref:Uncharacterized protein n=1 Tax=viral metagenome TaxID=1070528 RepID=A0A6C0K5L4_9ZZZZ
MLGDFLSSLLVLFILGLMFTISGAINNIFQDLRNRYLDVHQKIYSDIAYLGILFFLLILFIFLYKGSTSSSGIRQIIKL